VLLVLVLGVGAANLIISLRPGRGPREAAADLSPEALKELALKFEKQEMTESAAGTWRDYLAAARIDSEERAKIWYRIGKMYQEGGNFDRALDGYYRSENLAGLEELKPEISRRVQECLEGLGKFTALQNDLTHRVGMDQTQNASRDEVVAQIGVQKITRAELDKEVELQIDRQLSQYASFAPPEELKKQKENLLKRLSSSSERIRLLNQYIAEELLYRRAREARLGEDPVTRALLKDMERKILAQKVLEKTLADQIKITSGDLQTYYDANKKQYVQPERAKIGFILVRTQDGAEKVLARLKAGEKFEAVARELTLDETTKEKGGQIDEWIEKNSPVPGIGRSDELTGLIFATESGKLAGKAVKTDKGFVVVKIQAREAERQKAFEEVRNEVFQALRSRKEGEVQQALLEELKKHFNVVIYSDKFADPAAQKNDKTK
jgi:parvulin-like peptidyl-prolyl isomerase